MALTKDLGQYLRGLFDFFINFSDNSSLTHFCINSPSLSGEIIIHLTMEVSSSNMSCDKHRDNMDKFMKTHAKTLNKQYLNFVTMLMSIFTFLI